MTAHESVVTGDAVVLEVQIAQLPVRAVSALIDLVIMFVGYLIGFTLVAIAVSQLDEALIAAILIIFTVLAFVGYPVIFEMTTRGRSLGKMALGLRVVSDDGSPERFRQALFRGLASVIEIWMFFGAPAVICSMVSARGKRIGDVFAGTIVISERAPTLSQPPPMPPELAWWATSLQLSGLSAETAERARQFLFRASQLDPPIRERMALQIYGEVVAQIAPPPPRNAPAPAVLAAVLAERHRRELARLTPAAAPIAQAPTPFAPQAYPPLAYPAPPQPGPSHPPPVVSAPSPYARPAPTDQPAAAPTPPTTPSPGGFAPPD